MRSMRTKRSLCRKLQVTPFYAAGRIARRWLYRRLPKLRRTEHAPVWITSSEHAVYVPGYIFASDAWAQKG